MAQYNLTVFGKKHSLKKNTFLMLLIPMLLFYVAYLWCLCGGIWRFGENYCGSGYVSITFMLVVFGSIKINDIHYGLLPDNKLVQFISKTICYIAIIYYIYSVINYGF